jgi:hypothetical protein
MSVSNRTTLEASRATVAFIETLATKKEPIKKKSAKSITYVGAIQRLLRCLKSKCERIKGYSSIRYLTGMDTRFLTGYF